MRLVGLLRLFVSALVLGAAAHGHAAFHLIEIEQAIGGVAGDTSAQAVQLRFRAASQNQFHLAVGGVRLRAWDAAGTNPVVLTTFAGGNPANGAICRRVVIATPQFAATTTPALDASVVGYTMINPIPASYLPAGSITFENGAGTATYWRLSWGGASYTGPGTVSQFPVGPDTNTTMNPPFPGALPSSGVEALGITTGCNPTPDPTDNVTQYALGVGAATFTANNLSTYLVTAPPPPVPVFPSVAGLVLVGGLGAVAIGGAFLRRRLGTS